MKMTMDERRMLAILLLAIVVSTVAALASPADRIETLQGQVVSVVPEPGMLTVRPSDESGPGGKPQDVNLKVDGETRILKDGEPIPLAQVRKGDSVVINYRTESGTRVAITIGVQTGKA
jgi:hypothetical protein